VKSKTLLVFHSTTNRIQPPAVNRLSPLPTSFQVVQTFTLCKVASSDTCLSKVNTWTPYRWSLCMERLN